jgi:hydrogenase expression/formation protein HypC
MCLGIPGQIIGISDTKNALGIVDISGVRREINLACIVSDQNPVQTCVGVWVLVHVGFALGRIDQAEAAATLRIIAELGQVEQELDEIRLTSEPEGARLQVDALTVAVKDDGPRTSTFVEQPARSPRDEVSR